jgi:hypothetical protein
MRMDLPNLLTSLPEAALPQWFVAGGWAIDLFLGRQTREHSDVDIGIFRVQQRALQELLTGWNLRRIVNQRSEPWLLGEELRLPVHEIHADLGGTASLEILLAEEQQGGKTPGAWVYRRDAGIQRSRSRAILRSAEGIRYLAPEIVMLFKSKLPRGKDQADFSIVLPSLSSEQRAWLFEAIKRGDPRHSWLGMLAG